MNGATTTFTETRCGGCYHGMTPIVLREVNRGEWREYLGYWCFRCSPNAELTRRPATEAAARAHD